jgi:hypothetical protein
VRSYLASRMLEATKGEPIGGCVEVDMIADWYCTQRYKSDPS